MHLRICQPWDAAAVIGKNDNSKNINAYKSRTANKKKFAPKFAHANNQGEKHNKEWVQMKKLILVLVMLVGLGQSGCAFLGGAAVGAGATGAGYEYNAHREMQQLEEDYKSEKISRAEYEKRKQQIEAGSIIY
jgi:hypothetical protein